MKLSDEWKTLSLRIAVDYQIYLRGILYQRYNVSADPSSLLVILQGRNEYMGMYDHLLPYLVETKYWGKDFFLFDWRGQGESEGARGHSESPFQFVDDLHLVLNALKQRGFSSFRFLAHSTGSLIGLSYLFRYPQSFENVVHLDLVSPFFAFPQHRFIKEMIERIGWLGKKIYPVFLKKKFKSDDHFFEQEKQGMGHDLTDCEELSSRYFNPTLKCSSPTWGWLYSMLVLQQYLQHEIQAYQGKEHPTHISLRFVVGSKDTVVDLQTINQTVVSLKHIAHWNVIQVITVHKKHSVLCDLGHDLELLLAQLFLK